MSTPSAPYESEPPSLTVLRGAQGAKPKKAA
jgi:hypothetical protein